MGGRSCVRHHGRPSLSTHAVMGRRIVSREHQEHNVEVFHADD